MRWGWPAIVEAMGAARGAARVLNIGSMLLLGLWLRRQTRGFGDERAETLVVFSLGLLSSLLVLALSLAAAAHGWSPAAGGGDWMLGVGEWLWRARWGARACVLEAAVAALALCTTLAATQSLMLIWESEARGTRARSDEHARNCLGPVQCLAPGRKHGALRSLSRHEAAARPR